MNGFFPQGICGRIKGTNTLSLIETYAVPEGRFKYVIYGKFVCNIQTEKADKNRTRLVVGGNNIHYPDERNIPTADMLLAKNLFNSVISTKGTHCMTRDIKNFYLGTPLKCNE